MTNEQTALIIIGTNSLIAIIGFWLISNRISDIFGLISKLIDGMNMRNTNHNKDD